MIERLAARSCHLLQPRTPELLDPPAVPHLHFSHGLIATVSFPHSPKVAAADEVYSGMWGTVHPVIWQWLARQRTEPEPVQGHPLLHIVIEETNAHSPRANNLRVGGHNHCRQSPLTAPAVRLLIVRKDGAARPHSWCQLSPALEVWVEGHKRDGPFQVIKLATPRDPSIEGSKISGPMCNSRANHHRSSPGCCTLTTKLRSLHSQLLCYT
mmetsp:Transcript_83978/g.195340  ORF Transcript_83978/g.195340 Transcript_83978/m.195340 type:complete len:211 (-) Transcript_83978:340-972(-)